MVEIVALVVLTRMKQHVPFCRELSMVCMRIEFLLTMLSNFEREAALKDSVF